MLRIVMLLRYGGTYFDNDVISVKPLLKGEKNKNFLVAHEWEKVNNAVMRFEMGHLFLEFLLVELAKNFQGDKWGNQVRN
jgi:mannosyltransferase OCH1-like enzyme